MRFCGVGVLGCCSRKGERESEAGGLRVEAEGKISKFKVGNLWENGKTSSERETGSTSTDTKHEHDPLTRSAVRGLRS